MKKWFKKNFLTIKFPIKNSVRAYVCLSQGWSQGARKIDMFEIVLKWEIRFTLGLNAAKNTDYYKKCFK